MGLKLLDGKVVLVTGGSRGIGRAIALECARHGADVVVNYWAENDAQFGRRAAATQVVSDITLLGRRAIAIEGDVGEPGTGQKLVDVAVAAFGKVDVLAANAGICPFHAFLDIPAEIFKRTMEVNLHGAFYVTQAVARQMQRQGQGGAIVATSSISALVGGGDASALHADQSRGAFTDAILCGGAGALRDSLQLRDAGDDRDGSQ